MGLLLTSLAATATDAQADALVVDNADAAVQITGNWQSTSMTPGFYGGDYLFSRPATGTSLVKWPFPNAGAPGQYMVFARWTSGPNRASAVTYRITSADGAANVRRDQRTDGGRWSALGTYTFRPGEGLGVSLSDVADGIVIADAMSWVGPLATGNVNIEPGKMTTASQLQRTIDEGDQPWRLDPLEAARADAVALGMAPDANFDLISVGTGVAKVRAQQGGTSYIIDVVQPARLGRTGIWVVTSVARMSDR